MGRRYSQELAKEKGKLQNLGVQELGSGMIPGTRRVQVVAGELSGYIRTRRRLRSPFELKTWTEGPIERKEEPEIAKGSLRLKEVTVSSPGPFVSEKARQQALSESAWNAATKGIQSLTNSWKPIPDQKQ